jgi:type 1 glutamine amidotransferase
MIRHLLLSGGPGHPFAETARLLSALLDDLGASTTVVTEPVDAIAALRAVEAGDAEPVDLLTVAALRWGMTQDAYEAQRDEHAVVLDPADVAVIDRHVRGGGGLLALHTAVICFDADPTWHALVGASWRWGTSSHPPLGPIEVTVTSEGRDHPLTRGIEPFVLEDEAYGFLDECDDLVPLLASTHGGRTHPVLWARGVGGGRVVTDLLGHGVASLEDPTHRDILTRAAAWARRGAARDGAPEAERSLR